MAKAASTIRHETKPKKTSIGRSRVSKCMMNKHKRKSYKPYRAQGR